MSMFKIGDKVKVRNIKPGTMKEITSQPTCWSMWERRSLFNL